MGWTAPRTWVTNEVVTASIMNTHVRDNLVELGTVHDANVGLQTNVQMGTTAVSSGAVYNTWTDSGLTVNITPSVSTRRVLVTGTLRWAAVYGTGHCTGEARLMRGATALWTFGTNNSTGDNQPSSFSYLDSPATTSTVAYHVEIKGSEATAGYVIAQGGSETSVIVAQEIRTSD